MIIGVDPATNTGIAVLIDGTLVHTDVLKVGNEQSLIEEINKIAYDFKLSRNNVHIVIEDQYMAANRKVALKLAHIAGFWHGILSRFSAHDAHMVTPRSWQHGLLGLPFGARRADAKDAARQKAEEIWGMGNASQDAIDAALIALWWSKQ